MAKKSRAKRKAAKMSAESSIYAENHNAGGFSIDGISSWIPQLTSPDNEMDGERETMVARQQDLERNDSIVSGLIQTNVDNILTSSFTLSSRIDYRALGYDKEWADKKGKEIEALWRPYADSVEMDAARIHNFHGLTDQFLRSGLTYGEGAALPHYMRGRKFRTTIQMIDPMRITTPIAMSNDVMVQDGVRINTYGEETMVYVQKAHPADMYAINEWESIPMRNRFGRAKFIRAVDRKRVGQRRGKPLATAIMSLLKMRNKAYNIELESVVANSIVSAVAQTSMSAEDLASAFGNSADKFIDARKQWEPSISGGGKIIQLPPGEELKPFAPSRPNTAFPYFMEQLAKQLSTGVNIPYELLMKDFSNVNYSSARAALLEAWRFFMSKRRWLSDYWATPVFSLWLEEVVERGLIDLPGFRDNKTSYCRARWIGAGRGWVDPVKEVKAAQMRIEMGVSTYEDECAEQGKDWEEVFEQRSRENIYADTLGLKLQSGVLESVTPESQMEDEEEENVPSTDKTDGRNVGNTT